MGKSCRDKITACACTQKCCTYISQGYVAVTCPLVRTDNYCATAIWGIFCARDVSHEVQQVECCAACGVDKIFPKLLLHNISLHKGRNRCNISLGHVPATFPCVTSHAKTYANDFPCMTGILSGRHVKTVRFKF